MLHVALHATGAGGECSAAASAAALRGEGSMASRLVRVLLPADPLPKAVRSMPLSIRTCSTLDVSRFLMRFMTRARLRFWFESCCFTIFCSFFNCLFLARSSSIVFCERSGRPRTRPSSSASASPSASPLGTGSLPG